MSSRATSLKSKVSPQAAFTLIELLVAMVILMVIVLMLANLFQQSTRAWDTGMSQAQVGLEARVAVAKIQRDLGQAIAGTNYLFTAGANSLSFWTFSGVTNGMPQLVTYSQFVEPLPPTASLNVTTSGSGGGTNLPDWVEIELALSSESDFSGVRVFVEGRQYEEGGTDWVDTR